MERLGDVLRRNNGSRSGSSSEREAALASLDEVGRRFHLLGCPSCRGHQPSWPCIDAADYQVRMRLIMAQVPQGPTHSSFATYRVPPGHAEALAAATEYAVVPCGWLVLVGTKGTGKTHLGLSIVRTVIESGRWAAYRQVIGLLTEWRSMVGQADVEVGQVIARWAAAPVVVLDDLGAQRDRRDQGQTWAEEQLVGMLDSRYAAGLATVITTNLDEEALGQQMGTRLADRVFDSRTGLVRHVWMTGPSFRTGRTW